MSIGKARKQWQEFQAEELELQFNPRASTPDSERYSAARADINTAGLAAPNRIQGIAYGQGPLENLDIYQPTRGGGPHPTHIYIHGGYWRSREKEDFAFIGAALAEQGFTAVIINYPLCPAVTLDAVVDGARAALAWVRRNIGEYGGDPDRLSLSGHSAGAHLGAAILAHDWSSEGIPEPALQGAVLVSGIYDPTPTQHISVNAEIGITQDIAQRYNYIEHPPKMNCPVHVIVGGGEPEGWIGQSADYANFIQKEGLPVMYTESGDENHFSIQDQFVRPGSDILSAILKFA